MKRWVIILAVVLLVIPTIAHAQNIAALNTGNAHGVETLLAALKGMVDRWSGPLTTIAEELFGGLIVVSFVLEVGLAMTQGDLGMQGMMAILLRQGLIAGSWFFVVSNWSGGLRFGHAILASFQVAGERAGGVLGSPGDIMELGLGFASKLMQQTSVLGTVVDPGRTIMLGFCAIVLVIVFTGVAAIVFLTLAKALVVTAVATLSMGFAGAALTRSIAMQGFYVTVGSGGRLLAQQLLVGMGVQVLQGAFNTTGPLLLTDALALIGLGIILGVLVWGVPAAVEHLFHGSGHGTASISHAFRSMGQIAATGSNVATLGGAALAGLPSLPSPSGGGGRASLPAPSGGSGGDGSSAASSAGLRMRPPNSNTRPRSG